MKVQTSVLAAAFITLPALGAEVEVTANPDYFFAPKVMTVQPGELWLADIRFTDVNSPNVHGGHDGIRRICELATAIHPGARIAYEALLFDGRNWSIRWTMSRLHEDGTTFHRRGASAGAVADDGRVIEHTDYWSKAGFAGG